MENKHKKQKLLLHSCCGPCSTTAIFTLAKDYDITICYYNPNIYPAREYIKRKYEQIKLLNKVNQEQDLKIKMVNADYNPEHYEKAVKGLEQEKEGGARCRVCFAVRLDYVARLAKENNFDLFATTLTVSPHKNAEVINEVGENLAKTYNIKYLPTDLKKKDGYKNSIAYSKKYELYRQNYCGCKYSLN